MVRGVRSRANQEVVKGGPTDKARVLSRFNRRRVGANSLVICASTSPILRVTTRRSVVPLRRLCTVYRCIERVALRSPCVVKEVVTEPCVKAPKRFAHADGQRSCTLSPFKGAALSCLGRSNCSIVTVNGVGSVCGNRNVARCIHAGDGVSNISRLLGIVRGSFQNLDFLGLISFSTLFKRHESIGNCTGTVRSFSKHVPRVIATLTSSSLLLVATSRNGSPAFPKASRAHRCIPLLTCSGGVTNHNGVGRNGFTSVKTAMSSGFRITTARGNHDFLSRLG